MKLTHAELTEILGQVLQAQKIVKSCEDDLHVAMKFLDSAYVQLSIEQQILHKEESAKLNTEKQS